MFLNWLNEASLNLILFAFINLFIWLEIYVKSDIECNQKIHQVAREKYIERYLLMDANLDHWYDYVYYRGGKKVYAKCSTIIFEFIAWYYLYTSINWSVLKSPSKYNSGMKYLINTNVSYKNHCQNIKHYSDTNICLKASF